MNRLGREKSPYLLQHAHNPVDWFAWGDEAFAKARAENKPIFLSIGYSTCHWCHVMERESFENKEIAAFLNAHFISIKVDREERPDVDKIYMTFVQATTGAGGWPLNVFLTPDLKPFFGGTYFPPDNRHGRGSFLQVLQQIRDIWQERHGEVAASADEICARLEAIAANTTASDLMLNADTLRRAGTLFKEAYDPRHGGFGGAPKFPQPSLPAFLLRYAKRFTPASDVGVHDDEATHMILHTCGRMAAGGIHDQLGGGFARYSVDAEWLVPHFEKMLYDQAQLAQLYLDAHLVSEGRVTRAPNSEEKMALTELAPPNESPYAAVARDILDYVLRDMTHPGGGFYSAEDADSEGHEGKFYCWTWDELSKLLSPEEFNVVVRHFGITKEGNFVDHSHPSPLTGQTVLSVVNPLGGTASTPSLTPPEQMGTRWNASLPAETSDFALLASAKNKMLTVRNQRVRPHLDDKILTSWNGLMLGAMARAYAVLGDEKYLAAAEKNLSFIQEKLWLALTPALSHKERENRFQSHGKTATESSTTITGNTQDRQRLSPLSKGEGQGEGKGNIGTLFHRWRDEERDDVQLLHAYAFLLDGVIQVYETTLDPKRLDFAIALAEAMIAKFHDTENGGFWQSAADAKDLILRVKDDYDGAEPSGNSVATLALLKLAAITGRDDFRKPAEDTLGLFAHRLQNFPQAMPYMLQAVDFWLDEPRRVVIAGDPYNAKTRELLRAAHSVYQPNKVVLGNAGSVEPFAKTLPSKDGPMVYLCTGKACQPPTSDSAEIRKLLGDTDYQNTIRDR